MASRGRPAAEIGRLTRTGVALALIGVVCMSAFYVVDVYVLDRSIALFDLEEGALVTWASSSAAIAAAVVALLLSFVDPQLRVRGAAVAAGAAFVSFDDAAFLHERIASRIADELGVSSSYVQVIWPALYLPLLVTLAVLLVGLARETSRGHRLVITGLALLAGSVALEVAGHGLARTDLGADSIPWVLAIAVEESAEFAGWILVATGAAVRLLSILRTADPPTAADHSS